MHTRSDATARLFLPTRVYRRSLILPRARCGAKVAVPCTGEESLSRRNSTGNLLSSEPLRIRRLTGQIQVTVSPKKSFARNGAERSGLVVPALKLLEHKRLGDVDVEWHSDSDSTPQNFGLSTLHYRGCILWSRRSIKWSPAGRPQSEMGV